MYNEEYHKQMSEIYDLNYSVPPILLSVKRFKRIPKSKNHKMSLRLTDEQYNILYNVAKDNNATLTEVMNEVLSVFIDRYEKEKEIQSNTKIKYLEKFDRLTVERQRNKIEEEKEILQARKNLQWWQLPQGDSVVVPLSEMPIKANLEWTEE